MFKDKQSFKEQYCNTILEMYGQPLELAHNTEKFMVLQKLTRNYASSQWASTKEQTKVNNHKQLYYFSMEFLLGRMLTNNLMNLGIYDDVVEGLSELGIDYKELEDLEADLGLGNGGLGRLAACFLDSLASNRYIGNGNTIRYEYGLFKQKIKDGNQIEIPDQWLHLSNMWEVRKAKHAVDVKYYGKVGYDQGYYQYDYECVTAVPYDMPIIGKEGTTVNTLRMWSSEVSEDTCFDKDFRRYSQDVRAICQTLYPDDSTYEGRMLRLKQQYFFVSAGLQTIVKAHVLQYGNLDTFYDYNVIQLNDTHPVLAIPEFLRILIDEYNYQWDDAYRIVCKSFAYTNHTILQEALEKWPTSMVKELLPRIYMIIEEIHQRFMNDYSVGEDCFIIKDDLIYMANLAIVCCFSVNGVARLHTQILKEDVMNGFYKLFALKFTNQTNGISQRRWLEYSNPSLTKVLVDTIGDDFLEQIDCLEQLVEYVDDKDVQVAFMNSKKINKRKLIEYVKEKMDIELQETMLFDMQIKRIHGYKRQLLSILMIMSEYLEMKENPSYRITPTVYFFGGKAAPSYVFAKKVIKLIHSVANVINGDESMNDYLKIVFIENYGVSLAELLIPAANVSSQISTAGYEASGTSNMKFMMNGAITVGTMDGANVEIVERVGSDHAVIFGLSHDEVTMLKDTYCSYDYYNKDYRIKKVLDSLISHYWNTSCDEFRLIYDTLLKDNDTFFVLADFNALLQARQKVGRIYENEALFSRICLMNIAKSSYFSSDRTITNYANEIWHIKNTTT